MKQILLFLLCILSATVYSQMHRSNCAAAPYPVTVKQPDGSSLTYKILGNEAVHYFETTDGYTILTNKQGVFEYAVKNLSGDLITSGIKAKNNVSEILQKSFELTKHLRYSQKQSMQMQSAFLAQQATNVVMQKNLGEFPSLGNRRICVLLVDFNDEQAPYQKSNFENLLNQSKYNNTGSFKDAYEEYSYGKFSPTSDVYGWFRVSLPRASYGQSNNDGSSNPSYMANVRALITEAINQADAAGVDFSQYDNDGDGDVDGLMVFQAGFGAEQGLNGYIWSHRSTISTVIKDGKTIRNYCINPAKRNWAGQQGMVGIGVATHEFGHILGLPDLYDTQNNSAGTGNWGLMGGGPWLNQERTPCHFEPWCKMQLQWITPTVLNKAGIYTIKNSADTAIIYRINTPITSEYFLLENKQRKKFDAYTPGRGLAIWHVNTNKTNLYPGSNSVNTDTARYGVGLEQADGLRDLERDIDRGDAGDLFPGAINNRNFTPNSVPASWLHPTSQGVRNPSNVSVTGITQNTDSTITFNLGNRAVAAFTPSAINGCKPLRVTFSNASAFANNFKWEFGNGEQSTLSNPGVVVYNQSGTYTVKLIVLDSAGNRIDSSSQQITVNPSPQAVMQTERKDSNLFQLNHKSVGADYVVWRFGTNQTSTAPNPTIKLTGTSLNIMLIAYNFGGCTDTAFNTLQFWPVGLTEVSGITDIKTYPNPFNKNITVTFFATNNNDVNATITNPLGAVIFEKNYNKITSGVNKLAIDDLTITQGIYFIYLRQNNITKTIKVMAY